MLRVILLQKAYNPGYTYLRNGKIVRVEAFTDRRVKQAAAGGKRDDRTGDLFGDAGPTIDKPLKELIEDHEKVIDALESPSKAKRQAAADEQKEHLDEYREQLDTAAKVRLIEGSMDEFGGYELGGKRYTGEDAEMLVDEAREIAFATGKRIEDALLQIVPAEQLKADAPVTGARAVVQRQVNAVNRFIESATEQFGLTKEEAGRAWDYYVANKLVRADPVTGQYQLKDGRLWDGEVLRRAVGGQDAQTVPKVSATGYEYRDLTEPKVLFRAVSPEEWAQIQRDGEIRGGLNTFNGFDPRREVFFGDALDDELIAQGEDVTRRAEYAIQQSDLQKRYQRVQAQLDDLNAKYEAQRTELIDDGYTSAAAGMHPSMQAIAKRRRALQDRLDDVQAKAREQIKQIIAAKRAEDAQRGYSSVVLETRPVSGGRIYSGRHSGMRGDEYGFDTGAVKLADVVRAHYVKDRKVLRAEDWPPRGAPSPGIDWLLPPEQETQRAGLMLRVRQLTDAPQPKTAFDRRQRARDLAAAKKALKKMPEGMLTDAAAIELRGADNLAERRLLQIYLDGVGIAFEGAKDVEDAWKNYESMWASSRHGPPISRRYFDHVAPRYGLAPPKLSARGMRAYEALQAGGYFRKQLQTQYRGGEKFETRLHDASGQVVPGIGYKTWAELSDAGVLASRPVQRSSAWPSEWELRERSLTKSFPRVLSVRQVVRMS